MKTYNNFQTFGKDCIKAMREKSVLYIAFPVPKPRISMGLILKFPSNRKINSKSNLGGIPWSKEKVFSFAYKRVKDIYCPEEKEENILDLADIEDWAIDFEDLGEDFVESVTDTSEHVFYTPDQSLASLFDFDDDLI